MDWRTAVLPLNLGRSHAEADRFVIRMIMEHGSLSHSGGVSVGAAIRE